MHINNNCFIFIQLPVHTCIYKLQYHIKIEFVLFFNHLFVKFKRFSLILHSKESMNILCTKILLVLFKIPFKNDFLKICENYFNSKINPRKNQKKITEFKIRTPT